jgi:hypothetical protein
VLRYVDAGHGHCALLRAGGDLVRLTTRSLPLSVEQGTRFGEGEVRLEPGDSMLMYSDGLVERGDGTELPEALIPELEGARDAADLLDRLPARLADDVTVVILRRLPVAGVAEPATDELEPPRIRSAALPSDRDP